ncbi:DUF4307 domain-containing protein [Streptomyces varsoviensis]|uniref:Membrane protein n=1 Tax=Streptomyces varsoviensis TaxID=67373 RepID=A0ABR5JBX4_9ACTN|nr:DUF4307 domain-containing protein [Streptomyces varsoviensis]KOG90905.1 membrane protein [Streptomyces varsoviensis]
MSAVREELPAGRYGRSADQRADRKLKVIGAVLGAALIGVIVWFGVHHITSSDVTGELIRSKIVSDDSTQAVLELRKDRDATAVCTVRALDKDQVEVGRKDVTLNERESHLTTLVKIRTTARATAAELVGCKSTTNG